MPLLTAPRPALLRQRDRAPAGPAQERRRHQSFDDRVASLPLQDALKTTRGNRAKAARLLDTTERIVNYKVRRYGIDVRRFKS
jgi:transcriptional regulator with GAF, ATPase, and Fis domain